VVRVYQSRESGDAVTPRFRFSIRADTALFIFVLDMNHVTTTDCGIIFNITMMMMMMMVMNRNKDDIC